jgi:hypothetical protein
MFLNIIEINYDKFYSQYHAKCGNTDTIYSKDSNEKRVSTLSTLIQYSGRVPSQSKKEINKREIKEMQIVEEAAKSSLF